MPSFWAVSGLISTHESQTIWLMGLGVSCNHGLLAPLPSPKNNEGEGSSTSPEPPTLGAEAGT